MSGSEVQVIWLTIKVAFLSTCITMPVAIFIGWNLSRKDFFAKSIIESILFLPLVAPPVITGYLLLMLLGKNGLVGGFLYNHLGIKLSFNFAALIIASFVVSLPLAVRSIRSSFDLVDPMYEKVSLTLGVKKLHTFFRISLPLALPGIISGSVLSFARSLGEFGATITFAGNILGKTQTMSLMVYSNMQIPGKEESVLRLVIISVVISFIAMVLSEIINKKRMHLIK